ncbi:hypothetical protein JKA74_03715 [Marivirga sp. S37H4]|uniref:Uncharacterized protein n=1 Tax=Marivirga aurantiaca TaxID=2802615 RepID=A0A934WW33_9BACT|nr:hypothetical protein [Marivirga aurantiaca]MBK6264134.1 hypothetical protein [Marivirga aurantiaca]
MIKNQLLRYKIERGQKKSRFLHRAYEYKNLKKVGVIFSIQDLKKHAAVKQFIKTLEGDGIEVKTLAYKPKDTQNFEFYFDFFEDKDFGIFAQVKSHHVLTFLEQKLEYLFCLDDNLNLYMQYLLVNAHSTTRIGAYQEEPKHGRYFELMVKPKVSGDTEILVKEIMYYVRKISGNEH